MLSVGLMSGTSMDGIDAALLETDGSEKLIHDRGHGSLSYTVEFKILLKAAEYAIRQHAGDLDQAEAHYESSLQHYLIQEMQLPRTQLNQKITALGKYLYGSNHQPLSLTRVIQHSTELHALAVKNLLKKTGCSPEKIAVIGYPGQTMLHQPSKKCSIIVGDGQALANMLKLTVVTDFRSRDIANGGQGAPFAPLYHYALAQRDQKIPTAIVNCGGIANLTLIPSLHELDLIAFDTGPGNGLIDRFVHQRTAGEENMDRDGRYGRQGTVDSATLKALYEKSVLQDGQNYLFKKPPKALDVGDLKLIPELNRLSLEDGCATLEAFTAETIVKSLALTDKALPSQWILVGGGWNNPVICHHLKENVKILTKQPSSVFHANTIGWNSQSMEAQIFAYLAVRSLQNKALSLPTTTGVSEPLSGGQTYFPE